MNKAGGRTPFFFFFTVHTWVWNIQWWCYPQTSHCLSRSCWLKDPVTTAAVCSTGQVVWDYAVFVGHRGSHRWLWVTCLTYLLWSLEWIFVCCQHSLLSLKIDSDSPCICVDVHFLKLYKTCVIAPKCLMSWIKYSKQEGQPEKLLAVTNK